MVTISNLPYSVLDPLEDNPNKMTANEFADFIKSINKFGFDSLIAVVSKEPLGEPGRYLIVSGNHSKMALEEINRRDPSRYKLAPCVIKTIEELDIRDQEALYEYVFARNHIHGTDDDAVLEKIVRGFSRDLDLDPTAVCRNLNIRGPRVNKSFFDKIRLPTFLNGDVDPQFFEAIANDREKEAQNSKIPDSEDVTDPSTLMNPDLEEEKEPKKFFGRKSSTTNEEAEQARRIALKHQTDASIRKIVAEISDGTADNSDYNGEDGWAWFGYGSKEYGVFQLRGAHYKLFKEFVGLFKDSPDGMIPALADSLKKAIEERKIDESTT